MNLLLLLSALLSALTGVGGSVRAPDVAQAVAGASVAGTTRAPAQARVAHRPVSALPTRAAVAHRTAGSAVAFAVAEPLWTLRRRE